MTVDTVRELCMALPETTEKQAWGAPTFRVKDKMYAMFVDNHHGDGRVAIWCRATAAEQDALVHADPQHFFVPAYVGHQGWVGIRVDLDDTDWEQVARLLSSGHQQAMPRPRKAKSKKRP